MEKQQSLASKENYDDDIMHKVSTRTSQSHMKALCCSEAKGYKIVEHIPNSLGSTHKGTMYKQFSHEDS